MGEEIMLPWVPYIVMGGMLLGFLAIVGWIVTTWVRVKNGYPLEGSWGNVVYPRKDNKVIERIKLLSQETAQLRAELGSAKDRLITLERIVTDDGHRLTQEIESLRVTRN